MEKIEKAWTYGDSQYFTSGGRTYNVYAAIALAKDMEVTKVEIRVLNRSGCSPCDDNFMDFVSHVKSVLEADLTIPIIIADDGAIIDGRHRLAKAIIEGNDTIDAVIFENMPEGCYEPCGKV